jgi:hypothetical protein
MVPEPALVSLSVRALRMLLLWEQLPLFVPSSGQKWL